MVAVVTKGFVPAIIIKEEESEERDAEKWTARIMIYFSATGHEVALDRRWVIRMGPVSLLWVRAT
jgi:hypothetical protein